MIHIISQKYLLQCYLAVHTSNYFILSFFYIFCSSPLRYSAGGQSIFSLSTRMLPFRHISGSTIRNRIILTENSGYSSGLFSVKDLLFLLLSACKSTFIAGFLLCSRYRHRRNLSIKADLRYSEFHFRKSLL